MPATTVVIGNVATIWDYKDRGAGEPGEPGEGGGFGTVYLTSTLYPVYELAYLDAAPGIRNASFYTMPVDCADIAPAVTSVELRVMIVTSDMDVEYIDQVTAITSFLLKDVILLYDEVPEVLDSAPAIVSAELVRIIVSHEQPVEDYVDVSIAITSISLITI